MPGETDSDALRLVECAGVRFGPDGVTEVDDEQVMVKVARGDLRRITLRHGFHSAHPVVQAVAGAVLTGIGLLPTWHLARWIGGGGTFYGVEAVLVGFVFLGPWLMLDATKRGPYLEVVTPGGTKKLVFERKADPGVIEQALAAAEQRFGYRIERAAWDGNDELAG